MVALTFAAHAQGQGELCGYVDAEHRLQATFARLVRGLDLNTLYYGEPDGGEAALNVTKDYVQTGIYGVWIVDSVHGCVPKALRDQPIGKATMAELARLMSSACQVLEPIVAETQCVIIFCNHVKAIPGVIYGKDWSKPGGTALDYYASVQLRVQPFAQFVDETGRKVGHSVRVRVENSKVAAPFATATYDVFYKACKIKGTEKHPERNGQVVIPGVDIASCWFSVCEEAGLIVEENKTFADANTGEVYGSRRDVIEILALDCQLRHRAVELVYGVYAPELVW
jgi:protein RecA